MSKIEQIVTDYLAAWNETDSQTRLSLMNQVLSVNYIYTDSHMPNLIKTRKLHSGFIDRLKSKFPELKISLVGTQNIHHGFFCFCWQLVRPNGDIFTKSFFFSKTA